MSVVSLDANSRTWQGPPGQQVIEIATGMNYFDKSSQQWLRSDPSFVPSPDGSSFVAAKLPNQVTLSADLNTVAAVTDVTPDGLTLQSTPVAIGLYDAASGKSMIIASLTNSQGVLVDARHVLYPGAMVGGLLQADVVYGVPDCGSFHQDVVITKFNGPLDPTVWGLPASATNSLRLQIFTEFYGDVPVPSEIMHPIQVETDPDLRASMASPDLVDYTLAFGEVGCMSLGWAYFASADGPETDTPAPSGAVQVAKEFITAGQPPRNFLVESIPLTWLANGLATLPPVQTAQLSPVPGQTIPRTAMKNKAPRSSLVAANQDRTEWCAALPRPAARQRQGGKATLAAAKAAEAHAPQTAGRGLVVDYLFNLSGNTNSETFWSTNTYFVSGPVYVNYADIQCGVRGPVFKYPNNTPAWLEAQESLTITNDGSSGQAVFTAGDDQVHGTSAASVWTNGWTGHVVGYYGNPDLQVFDWGSLVITNFSFYYASNGLSLYAVNANSTATLFGSLFTNCLLGIALTGSGSQYITLNATACTNLNVTCVLSNSLAEATGSFNGCMFSNITLLVTNPCLEGYSRWSFTNCSAQNVTNFGASSCVTINKGDFTVNGYGALGNGSHDDQPAISSALQAAVNWCSNAGPATLYFQGGSNYFLNTFVDGYNHLLQVPAVTNLTLASDSATTATLSAKTTPPAAGLNMLTFKGPASGLVVSNLIFTNFHDYTTNGSIGVYFGENATLTMQSDNLLNIIVTQCTFAGFADGVQFDASANYSIYGNTFLYPLGRDSGSGYSLDSPYDNVGILVQWIIGATYWPTNFSIYNNTFNGLSGTSSLTNLHSQQAADGLLAGNVDGLNCYGNTISNYNAEGINLGALRAAPIHANDIYNNVISNSIALAGGWGIRCDLFRGTSI